MPTDYTRTVIESKNKTNVIVSLSVLPLPDVSTCLPSVLSTGRRGDECSSGSDVSLRREWRLIRRRYRLQRVHDGNQQRGSFTVLCRRRPESRAEPEGTPGGSVQQVSSWQWDRWSWSSSWFVSQQLKSSIVSLCVSCTGGCRPHIYAPCLIVLFHWQIWRKRHHLSGRVEAPPSERGAGSHEDCYGAASRATRTPSPPPPPPQRPPPSPPSPWKQFWSPKTTFTAPEVSRHPRQPRRCRGKEKRGSR